eukprot:4467028-Prymnesium_polylepis.1
MAGRFWRRWRCSKRKRPGSSQRYVIRASHVLLGPMAALHWRLALLVRRWWARRARAWELKWELGPYEYS